MAEPVAPAELHLVDSVDEAAAFLRWLGQSRQFLGLDTETSGLHPYAGDTLRLVQFGDCHTGWSIDPRMWRGVIDQALRLYTGPYVLHNANFDLHFLEQDGLPIPAPHLVHDTMLMDHLLGPNRRHGLKPVGERYWPGSGAGQFQLDEDMRRNGWTWATIPVDTLSYWSYGAFDPVLTCRIAEKHWPDLMADCKDAYYREMAVWDIARRLEKRGLLVDEGYTSGLLMEWSSELEGLRLELDALRVENPSSNRQVIQALKITERWEPDEFTPTGEPKADEKVLAGIDSEIARKVLRYRRLKKWTSTYLATFLRDADYDGRLHASIKTLRARTGRMSITDPPLQTLPRGPQIRRCVRAEEGHALWAVDYDNMEMRAFAHFSGDPDLIQACRAGQDLHTYAARTVYQDPELEKSDPRRQLAKNTQFCLVFGGGPAKIAETAGVPLEEAQSFVRAYKGRFTGVDNFLTMVDMVGRTRLASDGEGWVRTIGGRRLPCDQDRVYALTNYLIQGSCADIYKDALIRLDSAGFDQNMLLPIHDEVLFQFPEGDKEGPIEAAKIMEDFHSLSVPLTCEPSGPAPTWGDIPK